jgi:hypothetical protein
MIQKQIAMAGAAPKERVAGLVDVVDESEDLLTMLLWQSGIQKFRLCSPRAI